jgi:hypothetical protein
MILSMLTVYGWGNLFPPHVTGAHKLEVTMSGAHATLHTHLSTVARQDTAAKWIHDTLATGLAGWLAICGVQLLAGASWPFECTSTYSCCYVTCAAHTHKCPRCVIYKPLIVFDLKRATLLDPFETWA